MDVFSIQRRLYWDTLSSSDWSMPNFTPRGWYECDYMRVTRSGYFYEYEIKLSISDFRRDREKNTFDWKTKTSTSKWMDLRVGYERGPSRFYYVAPSELAEKIMPELPEFAGLIAVERHLRILKQAPQLHRKKLSRAIHRQAKTSALGRYWDIYLRMADLAEIRRKKDSEIEVAA